MSSARPGIVMVDRYRLSQPAASDLAAADAWEAHDQILDRPVRVTFIDGPHASAALDAARRAALVADPRLSRVLDVGTTDLGTGGPRTYIISEPYRGSSLTEIVSLGLVDAQQARAVVGEAAAALEAAAQRGVHHQALRPDAVRVDGHRIVVTGLGIDAALAGVDAEVPGETAAVADARNLVALAYYALTARWAGDSLDDAWIASGAVRPLPAQTDATGVVPISTLVPHVDEALDTLVRRTFDHESPDAPSGPRDVVTALAPWGEISVVAALPQFVQPTSTQPPVRSSVLGATPAPGRPGTPPPAAPVRRPSTGRIARTAAAGAGAGAAIGAAGSTQSMAPVPPPDSTMAMPPYQQQQQPPQQGYPQQPAPQQQPYAQQQYAQAAQPQPTTAHAPVPPPPPGSGAEPATSTGGFASSPSPKRRGVNPTPIVMALVVVLVIAGALWAVSRALTPFEPPISASASPSAPAQSGDDSKSDDSTQEPDASPTQPEVRPVIASGDQLDPEGGDSAGEHPEAVDLAYDADPSTFWYTRYYNSPDFAGLKSGIGYVINLEEKAPVTSIELRTNSSGGNVEVRATSASEPTSGPVLASSSFSKTTKLDLSKETVGDSFVLWITELPVTNGKNYLELNEIVVS